MRLYDEELETIVSEIVNESVAGWLKGKVVCAADSLAKPVKSKIANYEPYAECCSRIAKGKFFVTNAKAFIKRNGKFLDEASVEALNAAIGRGEQEIVAAKRELNRILDRQYAESQSRRTVTKQDSTPEARRYSVNGRMMTKDEYDRYWKGVR